MTWKSVCFIIAVIVLFFPFESKAELLRFTDEEGVSHFVDDISLVPEKYRNQLKDSKPLPELNVSNSIATPVESKTMLYQETDGKKKRQRKEVEVYTTSWCPHCRNLIAALDARNIRYKKYDIEKDMNAKKEYEARGLKGVPVTRIGSRFISGNNLDAIMKILYEQ